MRFGHILLSALVVLALVVTTSPKKGIHRSLEMESEMSASSCEAVCDLMRSCVGCTEDGHPIFPPGQGADFRDDLQGVSDNEYL